MDRLQSILKDYDLKLGDLSKEYPDIVDAIKTREEEGKKINPIKRALVLRGTLFKDGAVLLADFTGTLQGKDTSKVIDTQPLIGTSYNPFRAKVNVKDLDPIAAEAYSKRLLDIRRMDDAAIEEHVKRQEFDFPLWFKHHPDFSMGKITHFNMPFILQVAGCNFHDGSERGGCWYCFVDDKSNDGRPGEGKAYAVPGQVIDSMEMARGKVKKIYAEFKGGEFADYPMDLRVLRVSGGEPTITLDWVLEVWREIELKGLDFVGQIDSNLSTAQVVDSFEREGIYEDSTLEKLASFRAGGLSRIKVLTALKGTDNENLASNVQSNATIEDQLYSITKFLRAGLDIYPQMYNPNPRSLTEYLHAMDGKIRDFSLRVHVGPLKMYGPNEYRLRVEARRLHVDEDRFVDFHGKLWDLTYEYGCSVVDNYLRDAHGVGYKDAVRSDVGLKLL